jgi:hypothetical protein
MRTDSLPTAEPPPKLRWFQYSLRSLFVLTTLVAIGMSLIATLGLELVIGFSGLVLSCGFVLLLAAALIPFAGVVSRLPYWTSLVLTPILYGVLAFAFFLFGEAIDQPHPAYLSGNWLTHGVAQFFQVEKLTTIMAGMLIVVAIDAAVQRSRPRDRSYCPRLPSLWRGLSSLPVRLILVIGTLLVVGWYADSVIAVWSARQSPGGWVWPPKRVFAACQILWGLLWLADCASRPNRGTIAAAIGYLCMTLLSLSDGSVLRE